MGFCAGDLQLEAPIALTGCLGIPSGLNRQTCHVPRDKPWETDSMSISFYWVFGGFFVGGKSSPKNGFWIWNFLKF